MINLDNPGKTQSLKNPWLAVNLSMFFAGVGQIYAGERIRGWIIVFSQLGLIAFGFWTLFSPYGHTLLGAGFLFAAMLVHVMGIIDTYERVSHREDKKIDESMKKDPWFIVFLTQCIPGLGHLFIRKWKAGIAALLLWILLTRIAPGYLKVNLVPILIAVTVTHIFVIFGTPVSKLHNQKRMIIGLIFITWFIRFSSAYAIFNHFSRPFHIPSESMEPTLRRGDRIVVQEKSPSDLKAGDVIVFSDQRKDEQIYVKRLVGLPGDTIQILQNRILLNNRFPDQKTLRRTVYTSEGRFGINFPFVVPESTLFVLGDYSDVSIDSRFFGPVPETAVIGRAYKIIWPPDRIGPIR